MMKKVSLMPLVMIMMMISVSLFAQDREAADERAQAIVEQFVDEAAIDDDRSAELMNLLSGIIGKSEYVRNSQDDDMDAETKARAMEELREHFYMRSENILGEEYSKQFIEYVSEHVELTL